MPVSKIRPFSQEKILERVLPFRRVVYIESIAGKFRETITLHAYRFLQIFTTDLFACGFTNFHHNTRHIDTMKHFLCFCRDFQTPVSKMRQISQKNLWERVLPKRHVFYIDLLTVIFCVPNTLHVSRIRQIFTTELLACGLPNFHPPYKAYLHRESFNLSLQGFRNARFENQPDFSGKIPWSDF